MHFPELNIFEETPPRWGQVALLSHPVLIHLDHVIDFTRPPEASPDSMCSDDSGISRMPSEGGRVPSWPSRWGYRWYLSYEDEDFPPPPPRAPVHARLRFPDAGGSGGARGRRTYGSGAGLRLAGAGTRQAGGGQQQGAGGRRGGGGNGGGRRHGGRPEERQEGPPLIDAALLHEEGMGVDPFAGVDGALVLTDRRAEEQTAVVGTKTQAGKGVDRQPSMEEGPPAPSHENLQGLALDNLVRPAGSTRHGEDKGNQERKGRTTPSEEEGDVHGLFHAGSSTGAGDKCLMVGLEGAGLVGPGASVEEHGAAREQELMFGPHSPRDCPVGQGRSWAAPTVEVQPNETEPEGGGEATDEPADPLHAFLISCSSHTPTALLPTPAADGDLAAEPAGTLAKRSSGRLVAKPTAGLSTMDKIRMVLLKKSEVWDGAKPSVASSAEDLQRYRELYKKPLPGSFITAVEALIGATGQDMSSGRMGQATCA